MHGSPVPNNILFIIKMTHHNNTSLAEEKLTLWSHQEGAHASLHVQFINFFVEKESSIQYNMLYLIVESCVFLMAIWDVVKCLFLRHEWTIKLILAPSSSLTPRPEKKKFQPRYSKVLTCDRRGKQNALQGFFFLNVSWHYFRPVVGNLFKQRALSIQAKQFEGALIFQE